MKLPISRLPNTATATNEESQVEEIVKACIAQLTLDVLADPLFEVESRDRGGYFACFVFVSQPQFFTELDHKRMEIAELATSYGASVLLYPRTWTQ